MNYNRNYLDTSNNKFNLLYEEELLPRLLELEKLRKQKSGIGREFYILVPTALFVSALLIAFTGSVFSGFLVCIGILSAYLFWRERYRVSYEQIYKEAVIPSLLDHVEDAKLTYTARPNFPQYILEECGLTRRKVTGLVATDGLHGKIGGKRVLLAEMSATGQVGRFTHEVFNGLFCQADFEQKEDEWVWIYPEGEIVRSGSLVGDVLALLGPERFESPTRVHFADEEFESYFKVYGSSPKFAQAAVSPKLIEQMLDLRCHSDRVVLTIKDGKLSAAIWTQRDYLEPDAELLATDREMALQKFEELTTMLSIVEALPVNS